MKSLSKFFIAAVLALILSVILFVRVDQYTEQFDVVVTEAQKTTDGYDQAFIDMVNRLEDELAHRASFGYIGEKDPMTGQVRKIVKPKPVIVKKRYRKTKATPKVEIDLFRLSAIIYNDLQSSFTAIMMYGERSLAVEIGDVIKGRKVKEITRSGVEMVDITNRYRYDIEGTKTKTVLNSGGTK